MALKKPSGGVASSGMGRIVIIGKGIGKESLRGAEQRGNLLRLLPFVRNDDSFYDHLLILLRQIAFMARGKTDMLSGLIRKSPLAPLFPPGQAPPRLPARRGLQLGEKGSCPGGRPYGPAAKEGGNNFLLCKGGIRGILRIVGVGLSRLR
jgi:hypothetical protein